MWIVSFKQVFATNHNTTVNNLNLSFYIMNKNITDMMECIRQAESSLQIANSYLKDMKEMLRKIEEK